MLAFVRNLTSVFEKLDAKRSNCPRCDGSGLLHGQRSYSRNWSTYSNDPCWFCEGVGVMPLYGLRGFFLGRASAAFKTEDLKALGHSPIRVHLYLGKYPGTKCKFRPLKPSESMAELLFDTSKIPSWLTDVAEEFASTSSVVSFGCHGEDRDGVVADVGGESKKSLLTSLLEPSRILTQKSLVKVQMSKFVGYPDQLATMHSKAAFNTRGSRGGMDDKAENEGVATPNNICATPLWRLSPSSTEGPQIVKQEEIEGDMVSRRRKRGTRLSQQNHVRIKAQKEAFERALRTQRVKQSRHSESTSVSSTDHADGLFSGSWKELSQNWLEEETALVRKCARSDFVEAEVQAAPNLPLVSGMLFVKLLDKLSFIPKVIPLKR